MCTPPAWFVVRGPRPPKKTAIAMSVLKNGHVGFEDCIKVTSGSTLKTTSIRPRSAGVSSLGYLSAVDRCDSFDFTVLTNSKEQSFQCLENRSRSTPGNPSEQQRTLETGGIIHEPEIPPTKIEYRFPENDSWDLSRPIKHRTKERPWSASQVDRISRFRPQAWGCLIPNMDPKQTITESPENFGQDSLNIRCEYSPHHKQERAFQQRLVFPSERSRSVQPLRVDLSRSGRVELNRKRFPTCAQAEGNSNHGDCKYPWPMKSESGTNQVDRDAQDKKLIETLMQMRQQASGRCVHVIDFMRPFDKFRHGYITFAEFRRSLDLCGCFQLGEDEHRCVQEAFAQISGTAGCPTARINYFAFCEILQPKTSYTSFSSEHRRLLDLITTADGNRPRNADRPALGKRLSYEATQRTLRVLKGVAQKVQTCQWPIGDMLASFDPLRRGIITKAQLAEV